MRASTRDSNSDATDCGVACSARRHGSASGPHSSQGLMSNAHTSSPRASHAVSMANSRRSKNDDDHPEAYPVSEAHTGAWAGPKSRR